MRRNHAQMLITKLIYAFDIGRHLTVLNSFLHSDTDRFSNQWKIWVVK